MMRNALLEDGTVAKVKAVVSTDRIDLSVSEWRRVFACVVAMRAAGVDLANIDDASLIRKANIRGVFVHAQVLREAAQCTLRGAVLV